MAPRRKTQREAQLAFEALTIEGGLLSPEWLAKVAQLGAPHQTAADYRVPKGLALRDEIGRYWRIAQAHWGEFKAGLDGKAEQQPLSAHFINGVLRDAFGFGSLATVNPVELGGRTYPVTLAALGGRVPVVVAPAGEGLDVPSPAFGEDGRRRSAFGLAQEYVNANEQALWGLASDGVTLRLCRDNASLTRPAWLEADLQRIFVEERYSDFAALWLLVHETRFGTQGQPATECPLEVWRSAGREEGTRAREKLREGVEEALVALGRGFLADNANQRLRAALHDGSLSRDTYFQQLLRIVYRIIFLLTVEERGVLHPPDESAPAKELYEKGYGLRRLRDRSVKRSAHDRFGDLWEGMKIVLRGLASGEPRLGLPALGGLFADDQCPDLDGARLENRWLMAAIFKLSWIRKGAGLERVNWRDMGPEELGSVYESLLELVPQIPEDGRGFSFATGDETKGNARKTTGSYYTPDSLVEVLLDSALEPVVQQTIAANPGNAVEALLNLSIVDPAAGSGHFLLAAARRLAAQVARLQANGTPSATEYRHALRQVVSRCIYGVDLNPMAVELCRVSLWMEAVEPGRPLSFLDSHIQRGNALLGTTPELMAKGIPDAAFEPIEGDDKKTASLLKKKNRAAAEGQRTLEALWAKPSEAESAEVAEAVAALDAAPDASLGEVAKKEAQWEQLQRSLAFTHQKFVADAWCAAFVWPKPKLPERESPKHPAPTPPPVVAAAPTNDLWRQLRDGQGKPPPETVKTVAELAEQYHFFHWHLAFPQVFARGGFEVVLGNPPWERVKLQEQEFFASRHEAIAGAVNAAARKKLIAKLATDNRHLWAEWCAASREAEGQSEFVRQSGRYPLCGRGDVNTYAIFSEHNRSVLGPRGRAGFIVPSGIATDDTTKKFFVDLMARGNLAAFYGFENEAKLFKGIDHRVNYALVTLSGQRTSAPLFSAFARDPSVLREPGRVYALAVSDIEAVNPNSRTCPVFRCGRDAGLNLMLYHRAGVFWREADEQNGNPWGVRFMAMLHMANDSGLFRARRELEAKGGRLEGNRFVGECGVHLPLIEAKMTYQWNHRFGDFALLHPGEREHILPQAPDDKLSDAAYATLPRYWVPEAEVSSRLAREWSREWFLGWRDVTDARSSVRTVIACLIPRAAVGHKLPLMLPSVEPAAVACLYPNLCSFALDYAARQKVGGTSLTYFILKQLPVLAPTTYSTETLWAHGAVLRDWLLPRVLELTYTAWDLEPFAKDVGCDGPPFRWEPDRRFLLRAELDAAFFHLYGISRDDTDYIMETFPIVKRNDERAHGTYRTKLAILEIYDAMATAIRTGKPYQTRLDPGPADPKVAHEPRQLVRVPKPAKAAVLADGAWQRPRADHAAETGVALVAVLKALKHPAPIKEVCLAALLALEPKLVHGFVQSKDAKEWRRLVGEEADPLPRGVTSLSPETDRIWGAAVRQLRATGLLAEDAKAGTWGPGAGLAQIDTEGWADGRASWVVELVQRRGAENVLPKLSSEIRRWVNGAEAA